MTNIIKILHLEDLSTDVFIIDRELKKNNILHETKVVDTRADYIEALTSFRPDIVLSDHSLPEFNSIEALSLLKSHGLDIPFILVTGNVSEEFAAKMIKEGAWDYILKDRIQRLPNAVTNALEKAKLIRDEKKYIDKIIESERLFKQAEKIAHFGTWQFDLYGNNGTWSDGTYRLLGYDPGAVEPTLENFLRNIDASDAENIKRLFADAITYCMNGGFEFHVNSFGETRFIRSQFILETKDDLTPTRLTGFNLDITSAKASEDQLNKSNANLQTIFSNTDTAYVLIDSEFKIRSYNPKAEILALEQMGKILVNGASAISYFPPEMQNAVLSIMQNAFSGKKINYEIDYSRNEETQSWFNVTWIAITNDKNDKLGLILAISDISGRKQAELEKEKMTSDLLQRNKDLQQFAYIVSHNLRAPLTNIMALAQVLKNTRNSDDEEYMIRMLEESCTKLDVVIKDINSILEVKNNLIEVFEEINFEALFDSIISALGITSADNIKFEFNFEQANSIRSIKSYMHSILINLISNSIKFRKLNQLLIIKVETVKKKDGIEVKFTDNGRGFDKTKKEQVFSLYKRFHHDVEGKGMGLFMVKTQVERLGGSIDVQSEVDKGTTFTLNFQTKTNNNI